MTDDRRFHEYTITFPSAVSEARVRGVLRYLARHGIEVSLESRIRRKERFTPEGAQTRYELRNLRGIMGLDEATVSFSLTYRNDAYTDMTLRYDTRDAGVSGTLESLVTGYLERRSPQRSYTPKRREEP